MTENWKVIADHPGYEVSDQGHVRTYRSAQGHPISTPRLLQPGTVKGYAQVKIGGRAGRQVKVHALVLETFVGPRPPGAQGRHRNSDPLDNRLSNLVWGTPAENYDDRHDNGTDNTGSRNGRARLNEGAVKKIKQELAAGRPQMEIAEEFGVSRQTISHINTGLTWSHVEVVK